MINEEAYFIEKVKKLFLNPNAPAPFNIAECLTEEFQVSFNYIFAF